MIAFEPDPANAGLLEATIAANRLGDRWKLNRAACSNAPGTIRFVAGLLCDSRVATDDDPEAITVPTVDIFRDEFDADFIKMDIEGAEWPILADRRLSDTKGLSDRARMASARMPRGGRARGGRASLATGWL